MKRLTVLLAFLMVGCGSGEMRADAGRANDAGLQLDAGADDDAGATGDGGVRIEEDAGPDAGMIPEDAGTDAGMVPEDDAGTDAGMVGVDAGLSCAVGNGGCDALTTCSESNGAIFCGACPSGYDGTGATGCIDRDECATDAGALCPAPHLCINVPGTFSCASCAAGYRSESDGGCVDVNECLTDAGVCGMGTSCINTVGDYTCTACPGPQLVGNGRTGCTLAPATWSWPPALAGSFRALSICTELAPGDPRNYDQTSVTDPGIESIESQYFFDTSASNGANIRFVVNSYGQGVGDSLTPTSFAGHGAIYDINTMVQSTGIISTAAGTLVNRLRYCRRLPVRGPCAEFREVITYTANPSGLSLPCDPPPDLVDSSDLGRVNFDDYTSDFTPTFTVTSTAAQVTWLRDGVTMAVTPVVNGIATWTDDGTAPAGDHGYSVRHAPNAVPSAALHVYLSTLPEPLF